MSRFDVARAIQELLGGKDPEDGDILLYTERGWITTSLHEIGNTGEFIVDVEEERELDGSSTLSEVIDVLGTLIRDLESKGIVNAD